MAGLSIRVDGLAELNAKLTNFPRIAIPIVNKAIKNSVYLILRKTTPLTPVDTGILKNSLTASPRFSNLFGELGSNVEYAQAVHDMHPAGQRYLNPSKNKQAVAGFLTMGVKKSETEVDREFKMALDKITRELGD